ncbi:MAG: hypothetical protein ACRDOK_01660 [Streptosporangiaceae bacterium]
MTTATSTAAKITYRKTSNGEWVAYGPADILAGCARRGDRVGVTRRDGTEKLETIDHVGKTFTAGGLAMAYGYLARSTRRDSSAGGGFGYGSPRYAREQRSCDDCESNQDAGDMNGCPRHRGNPHC